jgi:protein gp37
MKKTKIPWCDHTFNPWIGCEPVSEGCLNCYAAAMTRRFGQDFSQRRVTKTWDDPIKWERQAKEEGRRFRVLCGSMCDVFDPTISFKMRDRLRGLFFDTPRLDWLLLTKRPEHISRWWGSVSWVSRFSHYGPVAISRCYPKNVMMGISVENESRLLERSRWILRHPWPALFLSVEPMLGRITPEYTNAFGWVIIGCEVICGRPGRPMEDDWLRELVERRKGPTFVKQMVVDGRVETDLGCFPEWARRREFPAR